MKTKIIAALLVATSFTTAIAQDSVKRQAPLPPPPAAKQERPVEQRVKMTMERMTTELKLDEKQQKEAAPIFTDFFTAMQKLRQSEDRSPDARQKLTVERDEKLAKILTEEQMKKYKAMESERKSRAMENRSGKE